MHSAQASSRFPRRLLPAMRRGMLCALLFSGLALQSSALPQRTSAKPPHTAPNASPDELALRLQTAAAARAGRDPGSVATANTLVLATALREMADLRSAEGAFSQAAILYKESLALEPRTATQLALAATEGQAGNNDAAAALARQIHQAEPNNLQADRVLSSALIGKGDFAQALEPLGRVAAADPSVETQYALANCLLQTKKPEDKAHAGAVFDAIATEHGDSGSLHVLIGRAYRDSGDLASAVKEFERALEVDPHTPHAHYFLGLARLALNEWRPTPEAEQEIRKEAELYPHDYLATYMTGFLLSGERQYVQAEPFLRSAATLDPAAPEPFLYLGLNAYAQGDMPAAETALRKAVALTGSDEQRSNFQIRRAYVDLGRILANSSRKEESDAFLAKARDLQNKTMEESQQNIASMAGVGASTAAVVSLRTKATGGSAPGTSFDDTAALDLSNAPRVQKLSPEQRAEVDKSEKQLRGILALAYNDLGTSEAVQGHFPAAADLYRKAEDWDASLPGLEKNLGLSEFRAGNHERAISPLAQALLQEPGSRALRAMLGICYFDLNRYREATRTFAPLGAAGMQDAEVGYAWAASLARTGDLPKATEVLNAYASSPRSADTQLLIGQLWAAIGDYPRAITTLQQLLASNPSQPKVHLAIGLAYIRSEHWPEAANEFNAELATAPGDPDALYHLGFVRLQQARIEDAAKLFEQVVARYPRYASAQYQLGKIQLDRNQVGESIAHLQAAEAASPGSDYIHYQLQAAYRKASRTDDAEKELAIYKQLKAEARDQAATRTAAP